MRSATHYPVLALESNGLRVLLRLGFGEEKQGYATTHRLVQQAVKDEVGEDFAWLIQEHLLLRRLGQKLCRRSDPVCVDVHWLLIASITSEETIDNDIWLAVFDTT